MSPCSKVSLLYSIVAMNILHIYDVMRHPALLYLVRDKYAKDKNIAYLHVY